MHVRVVSVIALLLAEKDKSATPFPDEEAAALEADRLSRASTPASTGILKRSDSAGSRKSNGSGA